MDAQGYRDNNTRGAPGHAEDNVSISSGGLSPDLGDIWRCGCPRSLDWDSDSDIAERADNEEVSEYVTWNVRCGMEGLFGNRYVPSWSLMMFCVCVRQRGSGK